MVITILLWHLGTTLVLAGVLALVSLARWVQDAWPAREPVREPAPQTVPARPLVSGAAPRG